MSCEKCGLTKCRTCIERDEEDSFANWLEDLEDKEQPEQCSIDNPDCENCGS